MDYSALYYNFDDIQKAITKRCERQDTTEKKTSESKMSPNLSVEEDKSKLLPSSSVSVEQTSTSMSTTLS
jgi:hypothetical protein